VMSLNSSNRVAKKSASLMLAITCDSVSWDMSYVCRLIVLFDIGSFKISFPHSYLNTIFKFYSMMVKLLTQQLHVISSFYHDFSNDIAYFLSSVSNSCDLAHCLTWRVWSAISLLKYSTGFSHKCVSCEVVSSAYLKP
jgi:hypothetical protein